MARGLAPSQAAAPEPDEQEPPADAGAEAQTPGAEDAEASPGGPGPGERNGNNATPEEQAAYENFIKMAMEIIYNGGRVNQSILDRLALRTGSEDESLQAIKALATVSVIVVTHVQDAIKQGGASIDPAVMYHAASEVMADLADLAGKPNPKTGKPSHTYTQKELDGAWIRAVDQYQQEQTASGDLPKGAMSHDWGEVVGAARAGKLEAIAPILGEAAQKMRGAVEAPAKQEAPNGP